MTAAGEPFPACGRPLVVDKHNIRSCGNQDYCYLLKVPLSNGAGVCLFLMLNPGSRDEDRKRHPTRERCELFAQQWEYGELWTCNLFALRSPNPRDLRNSDAPIGPDNDRHILQAARCADIIVCAWGGSRVARERARKVARMLIDDGQGEKLHTLGLTKSGHPRHPNPRIHKPKAAALQRWQWSHIARWLGARGNPDAIVAARAGGPA